MEEMLYVFLFTLFSLPLIFTMVTASISLFLTAAIKFLFFSSNEIGLLWFYSLALDFSLLSRHLNVDIEIKSKERIVVVVGFISKRPGSYTICRRNARCLKCKISSWLT